MRLIDADGLVAKMNLAIAMLKRTMKNFDIEDDPECQMELKAYRDIRDGIKDEPTIEPQRWIPCSERLPEEHEWIGTKKFGTTISDEVYVTFENEKGERFCKHMTFQNGELSRYDKTFMEAWHKGSKPIAWMPLPEPWKGEQP